MASEDHDLDYKLAISAAFRRMGYTVFQEVDLSTFSYQPKYQRKQVSDFDVLGLLVEADFGITTCVAECKSIQDRAMEVLLKLKGLKEFFQAEKAYLIQKRIDVNAREVARDMSIWCLDEKNLTTLLHGLDVKEETHVLAEKRVYLAKEKLQKSWKAEQRKAFEYLRYDFWTLPHYRNIVNLTRHLTLLGKEVDPKKHSDRVLCYLVVTDLAVAITRLTLDIMRFDNGDIETGVKNRIYGGTRERRDREALFDSISKLIPEGKALTMEPAFLPGLCEVVARFVNASYAACRVVPCLDHLTREIVLPDIGELVGNANDDFDARTLKLSRDVIHFACKHSGLHPEVFQSSIE